MESRLIDKSYLRINANLLLPGRRQSLKDRGLVSHKNTLVFVSEIANLDAYYLQISLKWFPIIVGLECAFDWHRNK